MLREPALGSSAILMNAGEHRSLLPEADEIDRAPSRDADQALGVKVWSDFLGKFGLRRRYALSGGRCTRNDGQENQTHARKKTTLDRGCGPVVFDKIAADSRFERNLVPVHFSALI